MQQSKFKIKLQSSYLEVLQAAYFAAIDEADPETGHEKLLLEHAYLFFLRLSEKRESEQKTYTLKLSGAEALAFTQFWQQTPIPAGSIEFVVISEVIKKIDQAAKAPKPIL